MYQSLWCQSNSTSVPLLSQDFDSIPLCLSVFPVKIGKHCLESAFRIPQCLETAVIMKKERYLLCTALKERVLWGFLGDQIEVKKSAVGEEMFVAEKSFQ